MIESMKLKMVQLIGLAQSDIMTLLQYGTADWFSPVSVANELAAQDSNTWLMFAVAIAVHFSNPPPPQLHLYRSANFMHVI